MDADAEVPIDTIDSVCGCGGKTSLRSVVYPALESIEEQIRDVPVTLAPTGEAAVVPLSDEYRRSVAKCRIGPDAEPTVDDEGDGKQWCLTATLADETLGNDRALFSNAVGEAYRRLADTGPVTIGKAHSVQTMDTDHSYQWFEFIRPTGSDRSGFLAGNVDLVHAFPNLDGEDQARIAACHSLNDCYVLGAHRERQVRPIVSVPDDYAVSTETVRRWFRDATDASVDVLEPTVFTHRGRGSLFGATATAAGDHRPPDNESNIVPGDEVLLHRPCGGLALYTLSLEEQNADVREVALDGLTTDNREVAEIIAEFSPDPGESFDRSEHVKFAADVSGPGIRGMKRAAEKSEQTFHISTIPMLDEERLSEIQTRWVVPDMTVETNGPVSIVASPEVIERVHAELARLPGADPTVVGRFVEQAESTITVDDDLDATKYIETLTGAAR